MTSSKLIVPEEGGPVLVSSHSRVTIRGTAGWGETGSSPRVRVHAVIIPLQNAFAVKIGYAKLETR